MDQKLKRISVFIKEDQRVRLGSLSDKTGAPQAELIRRAIEAYLDAKESGDECGTYRQEVRALDGD